MAAEVMNPNAHSGKKHRWRLHSRLWSPQHMLDLSGCTIRESSGRPHVVDENMSPTAKSRLDARFLNRSVVTFVSIDSVRGDHERNVRAQWG